MMPFRARLIVAGLVLGFVSMMAGAEPAATENRVRFSVNVSKLTEQDVLVAHLQASAENTSPERSAAQVNDAMAWALEKVKKEDGIRFSTGHYNTVPRYEKSYISHWYSAQSLRLESADAEQLTDLLGTLQSKLNLTSLQFDISEDKRRGVLDELRSDALQQFKRDADEIVRALGRSGYQIGYIEIQPSDFPRPALRSFAEAGGTADSFRAPTAASDGERIHLRISAEIILEK